MKHRPSYSVAATVVVLIVLLALGATSVKPLIPSPPRNAIATYPGDFLAQAAPQRIEWRTIDSAAFADARRLDRPILLMIGLAWSQAGREFDHEVLTGANVQNYLSRNFVCVRIDGDEMPGWLSSYLPVSRVALGLRPRFQIWVLEPDGKLMSYIGRRRPESHIDRVQFLQELVRIRQSYTVLRQGNITAPLELQQRQDIAQIEAPSSIAFPDFVQVLKLIASSIDPSHGGFPQSGYQDLEPHAWGLLAQTGQRRALEASLVPALHSPVVDLLDGGFYSTARQADWMSIEFDKSSVQNAEMLWALTQASVVLPGGDGELCLSMLRLAARSLMTEFVKSDGLIASARIGDEREDGRSVRSSIPPRVIRDALEPVDRERARRQLGLRVETNPQMTPFLSSSTPLEGLEPILGRLRVAAGPARFTSGAYTSVNATVAARLMEAGRALGEERWINFGSALFNRIDAVRVDDQVPHDLHVSAQSPSTLDDYLAYADAALQDYLTGGRVVSFINGLAVLQRGLSTFAGPNPGEFLAASPPSSELIPVNSVAPQIVDDLGESTSAKVVRLATAYGRMLLRSDHESDPGVQLVRTAYATCSLLAEPATAIGLNAAGFACSAAWLADDQLAVAVGPQAQELADSLFRLRPGRLVVAAYGPVRPDLVGKAPGLYLVNQGRPEGPFSLEEAARRLPTALSVVSEAAGPASNRP